MNQCSLALSQGLCCRLRGASFARNHRVLSFEFLPHLHAFLKAVPSFLPELEFVGKVRRSPSQRRVRAACFEVNLSSSSDSALIGRIIVNFPIPNAERTSEVLQA